ncbi:MAG: hypothetical protein AB7G80_06940 [Dongiaceae bacterium]
MPINLKAHFIPAIAAAVTSFSAEAGIIAHEAFDYATGNFGGTAVLNGGIGWGGAWQTLPNHGRIEFGNLDHSLCQEGLGNNAGSFSVFTQNESFIGSRALSAPAGNGEVWLSFVSRLGTAIGGQTRVELAGGDALSQFVGADYSTFNAGGGQVGVRARYSDTAQEIQFNLPVINFTGNIFTVMHLSADPNIPGNSLVEYWAGLPFQPFEDSFYRSFSAPSLNYTHLRANAGGGNIDEIRLGTSLGDVSTVPVPSIALPLAVMAGLAANRRCR